MSIIGDLVKLANQECWSDDDDLVVYDYSGSNVDDAFDGSYNSGRVELARQVLTDLGVEWTSEQTNQ